MTDDATCSDTAVVLTAHERGVLAGLIRGALRKTARGQAAARVKFGDAYDPTVHDQRTAVLESAYRKLGGDPARVTGRPGHPPAHSCAGDGDVSG